MYFKYDESRAIPVDKPYRRVMVPFMMADNATAPIDFSVHLTQWEPGSQVDNHSHPDAMEGMYCIAGNGVSSVND